MYLFKGIQGREKALQLQPIYAANMNNDPTVYPQIGAVALTPLSGHIIGFFFLLQSQSWFLEREVAQAETAFFIIRSSFKMQF